MVKISDILAYSDEKRRGLRLKTKRIQKRKPYVRIERPNRSQDELLEYFKDKGITTQKSLLEIRRGDDPLPYDYIKAFGSWGKAKEIVFGPKEVPPLEAEYMVKCIIEFDLWTRPVYEEACRKRPDILPSIYRILKKWGRWSNLTELAYRSSFKKTLDSYLLLKKKLGRTPSVKDCKRAGVKLESVRTLFGSKTEMDRFLIRVEENDEKE
jgi:hypothetical protein